MKKDFGQQTTKVKQLADIISQSISMGIYKVGDSLPSINKLSADYKVSRDTVFKAFLDLRERGSIDSTPGKGYYVTSKIINVLLLLDQYSPFKDVLYNSFIKRLPAGYKVDLLFHQYNERLFKTLIRESAGRYNKYIVMNFSNEKFSNVLCKIEPNKLLLLDFGKFEKSSYSYICQDFDEGLYNSLMNVLPHLNKYRKLVLIFPDDLMHPQSSKEYFLKFCQDNGFLGEVSASLEKCKLQCGVAYLVIKLKDVVDIIKQSRAIGYKCGSDIGVLAYNDIPSYEVIDNGITSLTIDWESMGTKAADFVLNNTKIHEFLPTEVILRSSL